MDLQKLLDIHEVQQRASSYVHYLNAGKLEDIVEVCFTQRTPGQKVQITDWGIWEGEDAAKRVFTGFMNPANKPAQRPNGISRHELTSPYIQVAEDDQTAIGVWFAPGWETGQDWETEGIAPALPWWNWGAYWMAFRKEDEQWKIWQLKFLIALNCHMQTSFVEGNSSPRARVNWDQKPKATWPDREGFDYVYRPDGPPSPHMLPLPQPYKTWSDEMSLIG